MFDIFIGNFYSTLQIKMILLQSEDGISYETRFLVILTNKVYIKNIIKLNSECSLLSVQNQISLCGC